MKPRNQKSAILDRKQFTEVLSWETFTQWTAGEWVLDLLQSGFIQLHVLELERA